MRQEGATPLDIKLSLKRSAEGKEVSVLAFEGEVGDLSAGAVQKIAARVMDQMKDRRAFLTSTKDPAIWRLLEQFQGEVVNRIDYFQLRRDGYDPQQMERWLVNEEIAEGRMSVDFYEYVPEQLYEPVAALMTQLMNDIPREDREIRFEETAAGLATKIARFRREGVRMPCWLLSDRWGLLSGLTFVLLDPASAIAKQELTGVVKATRGRKLAYFLKALAIRETFGRYPQIGTLETNCYSINEPILHINHAMGYRPVGVARQYRVQVSNVVALAGGF
jgi:mycothiol synthase